MSVCPHGYVDWETAHCDACSLRTALAAEVARREEAERECEEARIEAHLLQNMTDESEEVLATSQLALADEQALARSYRDALDRLTAERDELQAGAEYMKSWQRHAEERFARLTAAHREVRELLRETRMYALGTDCTTRALIERVDAALTADVEGESNG